MISLRCGGLRPCVAALCVMVCGAAVLRSSAAQAAAPAEVTGTYELRPGAGGTFVVYAEGGKLYEETSQDPRHELVASAAAGDYALADAPLRVVFVRNAAGAVTAFKLMRPGSDEPLATAKRTGSDSTRLNHMPDYTRTEAMIPMRDGVKLHAVILRPAQQSKEPLPFLITRTPYGVDGASSAGVNASKPELAASGYIFVLEDIRGRYKSEGQFVMNRPIVAHTAKTDVDETTDTRDTVDWLLAHEPGNSGKVGVLGISYPGFLAMMAGIDAHPAVKAISPQAPMTDVWMGDDFFHNGAFRETYGFDYVQQLEAQKTDVVAESKEDTYDFFLRNVNFAGAAKQAGMEKLPTATHFLNEPAYTKFWRDMAVEYHLTKVEVPTLEVGGWYDQEDMWGTQEEYLRLHAHDSAHQVQMVLGPWNHGGWAHGAGDELGAKYGRLQFGTPTAEQYRAQYEAPFFELYLKGKAGYDLKGVASFRTGVNQWQRYDAWPPVADFRKAELYLKADGALEYVPAKPGNFHIDTMHAEVASYVADPADPVPYRHRPVQATYGTGSLWRTWLAEDQRFLDKRKDMARFSTAVLDRDLTVTGDVKALLYAKTTGTDADWIVKLIDVAPDGTESMVVDEIFRGRYRASFEKPEAIVAGKVEDYRWSLHGADHTFLKGHKAMVTVQSSWFPLYDRNPQTFVPNIMTAPADSYRKATVTLVGGSRLEFESPVE